MRYVNAFEHRFFAEFYKEIHTFARYVRYFTDDFIYTTGVLPSNSQGHLFTWR